MNELGRNFSVKVYREISFLVPESSFTAYGFVRDRSPAWELWFLLFI